MRKKSDTVRYTAKEIKAKIKRGEDRTQWRKANAMTGKKLEASIRAAIEEAQSGYDWTKALMGVPAPPLPIPPPEGGGNCRDGAFLPLHSGRGPGRG